VPNVLTQLSMTHVNVVALLALSAIWPNTAKPNTGDTYSWPPEQSFYVGTFFDTRKSKGTSLEKFLVRPLTGSKHVPKGNELSGVVRDFLKTKGHLTGPLNLAVSRSTKGNPVAFFVNYASHQQYTTTTEGLNYVFTWLSVAVHMDVFTDESAFENVRRFETLYSDLQIHTTPYKTSKPFTDKKFKQAYSALLKQAIKALLDRAKTTTIWRRGFTKALFKIDKFYPPKNMSPEYKLLAHGISSNASQTKRDNRYNEEILFQLNSQINNIIRKQNLTNIGIIPPDSPWTKGKIIRLLERRPGMEFLRGNKISSPDLHSLGARKILAAWAGDKTRRVQNSSGLSLFKTMLGAAIYDLDAGGKLGAKQPACMPPTEQKIIATYTYQFPDSNELPNIRRRFKKGVRITSNELALQLVEYMELIADGAGSNGVPCEIRTLPRPTYTAGPDVEEVQYVEYDNYDSDR
jgi:hypothetical protein